MTGIQLGAVWNALLYTAMGLALFAIALKLFAGFLPSNWRQEIVEKQNRAVAIWAGLLALALATIIAATLH